MATATAATEATERFACFGSSCAVYVGGDGPLGSARAAAADARRRLLAWHSRFSRFDPRSELVSLNRDPRGTVPVSPMMARLVETAAAVGALTGGLVDATLVDEVERAGYDRHFDAVPLSLREALALAPARRPGAPSARAGWRELSVDRVAEMVTRPAGVCVDGGGIAKGLFADLLAAELDAHASFAIDCGGDIRIGGAAGVEREVEVAGPFEGEMIHRLVLREGAVATSGVGARSWLRADGRPGHHLIDPATGEPAFTGIVQVTAFAPSGVLAEALSKAALLSGTDGAEPWLTRGGVIVYDDGSHRVVEGIPA
jgi:thiamine biosynthesis lipoprotein